MQIPTISELYTDIRSDLATRININIPIFGKVVLNAIAMVQAGKLKLFWLAIARVEKNIFIDTADPESAGGTLERFGRVFLNRERRAAVQGQYTVSVTGTIGAVIAARSLFKSDDTATSPGLLFQLDVEKTLAAATDTMTLRALTAGPDARLQVADTLTSTSPLINVNDQVAVAAETTVPTAEETVENYRDEAIRSVQLEPQGGSPGDYRLWADDVAAVRFVYPFATSGQCGQVDLYVEANQADSTDGKGTPTATTLTDVEAVVDFDPDTTRPQNERGRRHVNVSVNYLAVTPQDVVITVNSPVNIDTDTQATILNDLREVINNVRPFVAGADSITNRNDVLSITLIITTIQNALTGGQSFAGVTVTVGGNPLTTSTQFFNGDIPFLQTLNF